MADKDLKNSPVPEEDTIKKGADGVTENETYSLNDDRRVKVLSPGAMVAKRFFRNRVALFGLIVLIAMFLFSFVGGVISPYKEDQQFRKIQYNKDDYGGAKILSEYLFYETDTFKGLAQSKTLGVIQQMEKAEAALGDKFEAELEKYRSSSDGGSTSGGGSFVKPGAKNNEPAVSAFEGTVEVSGRTYKVIRDGKYFYDIKDEEGNRASIAFKNEVSLFDPDFEMDLDTKYEILHAVSNGEAELELTDADGAVSEFVIDYNEEENEAFVRRVIDEEAEDAAAPEETPAETEEFVPEETEPASDEYDEEGYPEDEYADEEEASPVNPDLAYVSNIRVSIKYSDVHVSREFFEKTKDAIGSGEKETTFEIIEDNGTKLNYYFKYDAPRDMYTITREVYSPVLDRFAAPTAEHWLGTDEHGMDVITRLMYGGRISLMIGFIVEFIATFIGIILGGISGYFGGWVDNLIMRIVDIFYCIPSLPIIIIIGAEMDYYQVSSFYRMIFLMLTLGILGWPGIARMVRGQILSLREQEFMTATEAGGIRTSRRIFRHLIPNVIPQLIVSVTMGLGGTIITEATLSYLGLGVRFPGASWGNIISSVEKTWVLRTMWWEWIPAGILLLMTVLAFNLVGDGLRDAFDPKMKR